MKNNINFIFHTHLPFVRHNEEYKLQEEDWLNEAVSESYLPILRMLYRLRDEGIPFRLTFSISPTLCFMLEDELLKNKLTAYMKSRIELGEKEVERTGGQGDDGQTALMYLKEARENLKFYTNTCGESIISAFNNLSRSGHIDVITTAATHAYLPIYKSNPIAVNAQIETGLSSVAPYFDKEISGFWLPECGYYPGLENLLSRNSISWTSLASQAFFLSPDYIKNGVYMPVRTPAGVWAFARNFNLTSLVWSAKEGYPADEDYRDFYRDIGYDLPLDYIGKYLPDPQHRSFTGFKYHAITGRTQDKRLYNLSSAMKKTRVHASNFIYNIKATGRSVEGLIDADPVHTLSFDTELFGHWWFEGPAWLECVIRLCAEDDGATLVSATDYLEKNSERIQTARPAFSSWGQGGYSETWLDGDSNIWLARHTTQVASWMTELATRFPSQVSLKRRFLNQAARECLLAMASDWPFIMNSHTTEEYARRRVTGHLQNFYLVYDNMCKNAVNTQWLVESERLDNIFPQMDYNIFAENHLDAGIPDDQ